MHSESAVEDIKARLDIVEVISDHVALKRSGRNLKGLCPFHAEKSPSFMVSPERQSYHCFGCGAGGDVFNFVMSHEHLEFKDALEMLARRAGVELKKADPKEQGQRSRLRSIQSLAAKFFAHHLSTSTKAKAYIDKRGLTDETVQGFALGYAPDAWHALLAVLRSKGISDEEAVRGGLAAQGTKGPYDIFRDRIMFPITDMHGDVIAFGGRVMDADKQPKYLNSPDTPLFKKSDTLYAYDRAREAIREAKTALVVEGYMDAIMCHQHGLRHTVAPLGTALTQGHLKKLRTLVDNIVLVFDGDRAGVQAAKRSLLLALDEGMQARALCLPDGDDPDGVLRKGGQEAMLALLAKAQSAVGFVLANAEGEGRQAAQEALEVVARVKDPLVRDEMLHELADTARLREQTLREQLARMQRATTSSSGRARPQPAATQQPTAKRLAYELEVLLLSVALWSPDQAQRILQAPEAKEVEHPVVKGILERVAGGQGQFSDGLNLAQNEEERALISRLLMEPGFDLEQAAQNVEDCMRRIAHRRVERMIAQAQGSGDRALLMRLLNEKQKLTPRA